MKSVQVRELVPVLMILNHCDDVGWVVIVHCLRTPLRSHSLEEWSWRGCYLFGWRERWQ